MPRGYFALGGALVVALLLAWAFRLDLLREGHKARADKLQGQANKVVLALRDATANPKADWDTAPGQIIALGESNQRLKIEIEASNLRIDEMAAEAIRLKARASELQAIAAKAEAQRRAAYQRLSDMALTPGERADCMQLIREAEDALDLTREAGA